MLRDTLLGSGITAIGDANLSGAPAAAGTFTGAASAIDIESGIILTTGTAAGAAGPNDNFVDEDPLNPDESTNNGLLGNPMLDVLAGRPYLRCHRSLL